MARVIRRKRLSAPSALALWLLVGSAGARADFEGPEWRVLSQRFTTAVSLNATGYLSVTHLLGDTPVDSREQIVRFSGWASERLPVARVTGVYNRRAFESRTGQLWCRTTEGIEQHTRRGWTEHAVSGGGESVPFDFRHRSSIVPDKLNRAYYLLPDALMLLYADSGGSVSVLSAADAGIGDFLEIRELSSGSAALLGSQGLALLRESFGERRWEAEPRIVRWDPSLEVVDMENLMESVDGEISAVATLKTASPSADGQRTEERAVFRLAEERFVPVSLPGLDRQRTRFAWRGRDAVWWSLTPRTLIRHDTARGASEIVAEGHFADVAANNDGYFWLAARSAGLAMYLPQGWRAERGDGDPAGPIWRAVDLGPRRGALAAPEGLFVREGARATAFPWPEPLGPATLMEEQEGRVFVADGDRVAIFLVSEARFVAPPTVGWPPGGRLVGRALSGDLMVHTRYGDIVAWRADGAPSEIVFPAAMLAGRVSRVSFVTELNGGRFWAGGVGGLVLKRGDVYTPYLSGKELLTVTPACVAESTRGRVLCGTEEGGLLEYRDAQWRPERWGLGRIYDIASTQDGDLWIASSRGAHRLVDDSWVGNGAPEGLPSDRVYQVREDRGGRVWAATDMGLARFERAIDIDAPRCVIQGKTSLSRTAIDESIGVALKGRDRWDYTTAERLLFSYRLDGGDWSEWSPVPRIEVTVSTAGRHRLQARAMDRHLNAQMAPDYVDFEVFVPLRRDVRVVTLGVLGLALIAALAGVAVNRHLRLVRSYAEMEEQVAERTRELGEAKEKLLRQEKMQALGTLAAGVAHDFNSILSIIKGSAQIIERHPRDLERVQSRLERIRVVVDQGARLVRALLGLSRTSPDAVETCVVQSVVQRVTRMVDDRFLHEVVVRSEAPDDDLVVKGAEELIQQLLLNLVINAADAMDGRGEVRLHVKPVETPPAEAILSPVAARGYVCIDVSDDGCGIREENVQRIFEPFFSTKAFSSRRGTGLGLSMVYEIAKSVGYGLAVRSKEGEGATFSVVLPAHHEGDSE